MKEILRYLNFLDFHGTKLLLVLTANQRCGQNLAAVSTNVREFV